MAEFVAVISSSQEQIIFISRAIKSAGGRMLFSELEEAFMKRFNFTCFVFCDRVAAADYKRDGFKVYCVSDGYVATGDFF